MVVYFLRSLSGGFLHHVVKVFPEGCSCPVALFISCNGVLETLVVVVVDHTNYQCDALNIIYSSNILLYMFRVSSTHLQEDTVVCEQHMVPSLSIES